jgi:hypothetical protein
VERQCFVPALNGLRDGVAGTDASGKIDEPNAVRELAFFDLGWEIAPFHIVT